MAHPRHLRRWHRPHLAVVLAVVCLVAQLAAGIHVVAVPHVECAEHGELVHADDHGGHGPAVVAAAAEATERAGWLARETAPNHDAHEHCGVMSTRRPHPAAFELAAVRVPPTDTAGAAPALDAPLVARPLYRLAPKVSPPARA